MCTLPEIRRAKTNDVNVEFNSLAFCSQFEPVYFPQKHFHNPEGLTNDNPGFHSLLKTLPNLVHHPHPVVRPVLASPPSSVQTHPSTSGPPSGPHFCTMSREARNQPSEEEDKNVRIQRKKRQKKTKGSGKKGLTNDIIGRKHCTRQQWLNGIKIPKIHRVVNWVGSQAERFVSTSMQKKGRIQFHHLLVQGLNFTSEKQTVARLHVFSILQNDLWRSRNDGGILGCGMVYLLCHAD